jgi:hypothetical protein
MHRTAYFGEGTEADANRPSSLSCSGVRRSERRFPIEFSMQSFRCVRICSTRFLTRIEAAQVYVSAIVGDLRPPRPMSRLEVDTLQPKPISVSSLVVSILETGCLAKIGRTVVELIAVDVVDQRRNAIQINSMMKRIYDPVQQDADPIYLHKPPRPDLWLLKSSSFCPCLVIVEEGHGARGCEVVARPALPDQYPALTVQVEALGEV